MQSTAFAIVRCFARLPDDRDHFGFVVELDRLLRPHDRLQVRHHRGQHAEEDGGKFRNVVALRTFLDMVEIIQPETDDFSRLRDGQCDISIRPAAGARRPAHSSPVQPSGLRSPLIRRRTSPEIARHIRIRTLQIDDIVAIDHAKPHAILDSKPTILMSPALPKQMPGRERPDSSKA